MSESEGIPQGFTLRHTLHGHSKAIAHICWSPDGQKLASYSLDNTIRIWDVQSNKLLRTINWFRSSIRTMAWSPDGTMLAAGGRVYSTTCSLGHENRIGEAFCDECGEPLADDPYNLWIASTETGNLVQKIQKSSANGDVVYGLEWSLDGTMLASSNGSKVDLWSSDKVQQQRGNALFQICTKCKTQNPDSEAFCYNCGSPLEGNNLFQICTKCRAQNPEGETYCSNCGSPLSETISSISFKDMAMRTLEVVSPHAMARSPNAAWLAVASFSSACPFCGFRNVKGSAFCDECGTPLSPSSGNDLLILDTARWQVKNTFVGHTGPINDIVWAPDQTFLVSGSDDCTIRIWRPEGQKQILEGFITNVTGLSLSHDGSLLASRSTDGNICIWDTQHWEMRAILEEPTSSSKNLVNVAFHPHAPMLATLSESDTVINIWDVSIAELKAAPPVVASSSYRNAKIVLVGETGVGKSGLSLVLTGQSFKPTDSTHGREVLTFEEQNLRPDVGQKEQRELLLWDLAGQPGYRLIHQLYLNETSVALVVFDSRSETDPLAGIDHWVRALRVARQTQERESSEVQAMKMFLVAARTDRGGKNIGSVRIERILKKEGFDGYFATSAKENIGIAELIEAVRQAVDWEKLTRVTSSLLFQSIKEFLASEKESGRLLVTYDDLFEEFCRKNDVADRIKDIATQFKLCLKQVEQKGLIKRLSFKEYILLQPELLDSYASSLVLAVRDEPDELGSIAEQRVLSGDFSMPASERIQNREQEQLLLIAMVEDLIKYEIALREIWEDVPYLVFPSQSMRENPDLPNPEGKAAIFTFEGPITHIYATLVVRLSRSGLFRKVDLWRNAVTYTTDEGGTYGIFLREISGGRAELTLFFDQAAKEETRFHFEEYVRTHLERRALKETVERRPIFVCSDCGTPLDDLAVKRRKERKLTWMNCGVCDTRVSLLDTEERLAATPDSLVSAMDSMADRQRDQSTAATSLQGKIATGDFDVFLCYNREDKLAVKAVGELLKGKRILPWLDEWELRPGFPWQQVLEQQIGQIKSAAVFVGNSGIGPWQQKELYAFLRQFVNRDCPVIPVILADAPEEPKLPIFLDGMTWVDFRQPDPDPMTSLIWGITGKRDPY